MTDKFDYFINRTDRELQAINKKIDTHHITTQDKMDKIKQEISKEIKELNSWKWISFGIYLAVSSIAGGAMGLLAIWVEYRK